MKRSKFDTNFIRLENNFYCTFDEKAHHSLNNHLPKNSTFVEPCAGYGDLIDGLEKFGHKCIFASELIDRPESPKKWLLKDALTLTENDVKDADFIITNPPWERKILHLMIDHFRHLKPTWLIFEADWAHTKQSIPFMKYCSDIVSIGRMKWIRNSKHGGLKDCCWYKFNKLEQENIRFHIRNA